MVKLLRHLCRPGGEMVLVADATQDVYGTSRLWTEQAMTGAGFSGSWSELPISYRLPKSLLDLAADFAERFLPPDDRLSLRSPQDELAITPCHLRWVQVDGDQAVDDCVGELLDLVTSDDTASRAMTDLTVLVDKIDDGVSISRALNAKNIKTSETFATGGDGERSAVREDRRKKLAFWKGQPRVKVTTLHSFKGWEGRMHVLNLTHARSSRDFVVIYAGLTRLKRHPDGSLLTVVCGEPRLRQFGQSWPEYVDRTRGRPSLP